MKPVLLIVGLQLLALWNAIHRDEKGLLWSSFAARATNGFVFTNAFIAMLVKVGPTRLHGTGRRSARMSTVGGGQSPSQRNTD